MLGSASVILDDHGRILLVKHGYGELNWELPGGRGEANESAEDTARREAREDQGPGPGSHALADLRGNAGERQGPRSRQHAIGHARRSASKRQEPGAESESRDTNMVFISAPPTRLEPDVRYLAWHLSADAVPQLLAAMPHLSVGNRGAVSAALLHRWADPQDSDWRSWNWSASRARRLVSARQAELSDMLPRRVEPKH